MTAPVSTGPLAGIKVLELGTLIAGPFCARMLGEFGADVIKVETPGDGDPLRKWRELYEGTSLWWFAQARNKKSVTVNLKAPEGQAIVRGLAAKADIVVENFRPGTMEKWGLGYERPVGRQPGSRDGAAVGVRADRAVQGSARLRRHRRVDGRHALHHRLPRSRAGPRGHFHRRFVAAMFGVIGALSAIFHREPTSGRARWWTWRCTRPCSR